MKRTELVRSLRQDAKAADAVFEMIREGANHEVWSFAGSRLTIPRHREINEFTARAILKDARDALGE